jgi:hypothetical protein
MSHHSTFFQTKKNKITPQNALIYIPILIMTMVEGK